MSGLYINETFGVVSDEHESFRVICREDVKGIPGKIVVLVVSFVFSHFLYRDSSGTFPVNKCPTRDFRPPSCSEDTYSHLLGLSRRT